MKTFASPSHRIAHAPQYQNQHNKSSLRNIYTPHRNPGSRFDKMRSSVSTINSSTIQRANPQFMRSSGMRKSFSQINSERVNDRRVYTSPKREIFTQIPTNEQRKQFYISQNKRDHTVKGELYSNVADPDRVQIESILDSEKILRNSDLRQSRVESTYNSSMRNSAFYKRRRATPASTIKKNLGD